MPTRRTLLTAAGATGLVAVAGGGALALSKCSDGGTTGTGEPDAPCVPRSSLTLHGRVGTASLVYEEDRQPREFAFDGGFHAQLAAWLDGWRAGAGALGPVTTIDTYGAWTDGGTTCSSWHNSGRAFDIARLRAGGRTLVSCRQDLWKDLPADQMRAHRRAYWRLAASLHTRFAYVLTYYFDDLHRNHIHLDNGVSGAGAPVFNTRSRVQNQAIQACCAYVWDQPCQVTGTWDSATRRASRAVLERIGRSGELTARDNWAAFMGATATKG
ncbi:hypothetical protein [Mariniluteicoccus flavus]